MDFAFCVICQVKVFGKGRLLLISDFLATVLLHNDFCLITVSDSCICCQISTR